MIYHCFGIKLGRVTSNRYLLVGIVVLVIFELFLPIMHPCTHATLLGTAATDLGLWLRTACLRLGAFFC